MQDRGSVLSAAVLAVLIVLAPAAPDGVARPHAPTARTPAGANGRIVFGRWSSAATSDIFTVRPDGSALKRLTSTGTGWFPAWSPDGREVAFTGRKNAIWIMNADGSHRRQVTHPGKTADQAASWSPDGTRIAFDRFKATTPPTVIFVVRADGSRLRRLRGGLDPAWSPDGRLIAFTRGDGIWVMRPNGRGARRIVSNGASQASWSPDGTRLTLSSGLDIWLVKTDGTDLRRLTSGKATDKTPAWSPDGRRIAFYRNGSIWTIRVNGGGARKVTRPGKNTDVDPDWRPISRTRDASTRRRGVGARG